MLENHQTFSRENLLSLDHRRKQCEKVPTTSTKALQESYAVSLLVAKAKKSFTIAEDLLLPAAVVLAETMLDKNAADKLKTVPLSNDTFPQNRKNGSGYC